MKLRTWLAASASTAAIALGLLLVAGHPAGARSALAAVGGGLPRAGTDHSHRSREVPLGMPSVRVPAKLCDLSPLAGMS